MLIYSNWKKKKWGEKTSCEILTSLLENKSHEIVHKKAQRENLLRNIKNEVFKEVFILCYFLWMIILVFVFQQWN